MTELEKIEYAKSFIDKLANGINPLDDSSIPENDIANNVRLSRCFFYVSDILRQVIENGGVRASKKEKHHKKEFSLTTEERSKIQLSEIPLTVSEISNHLNSLVNLETTKKISASSNFPSTLAIFAKALKKASFCSSSRIIKFSISIPAPLRIVCLSAERPIIFSKSLASTVFSKKTVFSSY